jgi:hypothetical protein
VLNEIVNIIGLKYKKKYKTDEDMRPCATGRPGQARSVATLATN